MTNGHCHRQRTHGIGTEPCKFKYKQNSSPVVIKAGTGGPQESLQDLQMF